MTAIKYSLEDYIGVRFGRLVVVGEDFKTRKSGRKVRVFCCRCDCGNITLITPHALISEGVIKSCGCYRSEWTTQTKRKTQEQFIEESKARYPGLFEYDKVVYTTNKDNVIITCVEHGDFQVTPNNHLRKKGGCPLCSSKHISNSHRKDQDWFIEKAKTVHGDKYDYSLSKYISATENVELICKTHGSYNATPHNHLRGTGCPLCSKSGFKPNLPAWLYVLKIEGMPFTFTGYGISNQPERRLSKHKRNLSECGFIIAQKEMLYCENGYVIAEIEKELKNKFEADSRTNYIEGFMTESCFKSFNEVLSFAKTTLEQLKENEHGSN